MILSCRLPTYVFISSENWIAAKCPLESQDLLNEFASKKPSNLSLVARVLDVSSFASQPCEYPLISWILRSSISKLQKEIIFSWNFSDCRRTYSTKYFYREWCSYCRRETPSLRCCCLDTSTCRRSSTTDRIFRFPNTSKSAVHFPLRPLLSPSPIDVHTLPKRRYLITAFFSFPPLQTTIRLQKFFSVWISWKRLSVDFPPTFVQAVAPTKSNSINCDEFEMTTIETYNPAGVHLYPT